jgi:hypothetical protein
MERTSIVLGIVEARTLNCEGTVRGDEFKNVQLRLQTMSRVPLLWLS